MRYPPHILEEIRARLPVSSIVGRKVRLKKAGREWRGLSPFNAEKTPSFYANDQKQFYHCFSSGKHGDIFTFLIETEGLSFPEAVERLAGEAGVDLPKIAPERQEVVEERKTLVDVLDLACRYFEAQLAGGAGREAREYLGRRQVAESTQAEFRIGFAPDGRSGLLEHLRAKGIADDLILRAGLVIRPDDGRPLYDRFRGRIMFPIQDTRGQVVAFGGRGMSDAVQPKYLNSPETEVFHKGRIVFNGNRARAAAHRGEPLAVVEGYLDAIAAFQAGHKAVVATLGTAFTEEQIEALWQVSAEPILCLDGDKAGRAAAFRALDRMLPLVKVGKSFRFAFLPDGQDPDDLIRQKGLAGFRRHLEEAAKLWDVLWQRESGQAQASDPDSIARLDQTLRRLIGEMTDPQLRYRYELTAKLSIRELSWRATRQRFHDPGHDVSFDSMLRSSRLFSGEPTRLVGLERILLGLCVEFPDFAAQASDDLYRIRFRGSLKLPTEGALGYQPFFDDLMGIIEDEPGISTEGIHRRINPVFYELLDDLHGREGSGRRVGHAVRRRLPALGYVFDEEFYSRLFWNLINALVARELEDELEELSALMLASPAEFDDSEVERLTAIQTEIHMRRERFTAEENELAELASAYRPAKAA